MTSPYEQPGFKVFKWILIIVGGVLAILSDNHPWLKGVVWTLIVFGICEYPFVKSWMKEWFWKANAVLFVLHAAILWLGLPLMSSFPYVALFVPALTETMIFILILSRLDPLRGES